MTLLHAAPHIPVCALLGTAAWPPLREGHPGRDSPTHRRTDPMRHDSSKEHDMTCTLCGALIRGDYTSDAHGTYCTNCVDHPNTPANGVRIYDTERPTT